MALNLVKAGYLLSVFARRPQVAEPLISTGATLMSSPKHVAEESDLIITMVSDTPDVQEVLLGNEGVIHAIRPHSVVVDMSTISPSATQAMAKAFRTKDVEMLDAPVSGGVQGAMEGTLSIMVGGNASTFEQILPVFQCVGKEITHVGNHGAGQIAKACNQILVGQTITAVAEALLLAQKSGVDPSKVRKALLGGFAYSKILEVHGQRMLERNFAPGFKAKLHHKDMRIALNYAKALSIALPGAELVLQHLEKLVETGGGEMDSAAIATII